MSTSGGATARGSHCLTSWLSTKKITLSSAEAELMAAVKAAAEGVGVLQMAEEAHMRITVDVKLGSSAALGAVARKGDGKFRHVKVANLWLQELADERSGEEQSSRQRTSGRRSNETLDENTTKHSKSPVRVSRHEGPRRSQHSELRNRDA